MAASNNKGSKIGQLHQSLKKHFKTPTQPERPLLELLLYACLLEDAPFDAAEEGMARLEQEYFDWNEVRVTTISELSGALRCLPNPQVAASRLKRNLHSLFETHYGFDLEDLRKLNLGKAVESLEKLPAMTPFVLAYVAQNALNGHMIAVDNAATRLLIECDIITAEEIQKGKSLGLDRAIPKAKGIEFTSLLHQAATTLMLDKKNEAVWAIIVAVNPEAKQRLDKPTKKVAKPSETERKPEKPVAKQETGVTGTEKNKPTGKSVPTKKPEPKSVKKPAAPKTAPKTVPKTIARRKPK